MSLFRSFLIIAKWSLLLGLFVILAAAGAIMALSWNLPSVNSLQNYRPPVASEVFSEEFIKIGEFYREKRFYVPIRQIPPLLVKAFIAAEDDQFYHHRGISPSGIFRAMVKNIVAGKVRQGGSTITQQVAKQLILQTRERSYLRKAKEGILAFKMERYLNKDQILEIYLNEVFLGSSSYGVAAASETFFGKNVADLTVAEIAIIAGLMKAPSRDNPHASWERARGRQIYVLKRMYEEGYITKDVYDEALDQEIQLNPFKDLNLVFAPYYVEHIRRYVQERYGDDKTLTGGLQIYTTLRARDAEAARLALRRGVEELDRHQGYRGPIKKLGEKEIPTFLEKLKEENGEPPYEPDTRIQALVTEVNDKKEKVMINVGMRNGLIPLKDMVWARKPDPDRYWENALIKKPSEALRKGDVVFVQPIRDETVFEGKLPDSTLLFSLAQEPVVQGTLLSMNPHSGEVHAMVGGYDYQKSEFNRAVQAQRQPGSAFKPVVYSTALDNGYTAASIIVDSPIVYDDPTTDMTWRPKNFGGKFHGDTIFRDCLIKSRNIPTVKIVRDVGIDKVMERARALGIRSPLARDFSMALGSSGTTPLEIITTYASFASNGRKTVPVFVKKIVDRDGEVLERNVVDDPALNLLEQAAVAQDKWTAQISGENAIELGKDPEVELPENYALTPQTAYIMTHLLKQVIRSGTGQRAKALNRPAAGKTGTTNDNRDAWFVGFTPDLLAAVWVGMDQGNPLGPREEGSRAALPIWLEYMQAATQGYPVTDFSVPDGIIFAQIDPKDGRLAGPDTKNPVFEAFREETQPKETTEEAETRKSPEQFFLQE